jgi:Tol biopolymer transport system component
VPRISGRLLDWAIVMSGGLVLVGLALVSRAANAGQLENTLISPWHLPLYAGVALAAAVLISSRVEPGRERRGLSLPPAYQVSAVGLVLFGLGFVGDVVWQGFAGDATGPDALVTPTHLLVFLGIGLLLAGPLRSPSTTPDQGFVGQLPAVLALGLLLTLAGGLTQFANPVTNIPASGSLAQRELDGQGELWSMRADGTGQTRLSSAADGVRGDPSWSRDGAHRASVTYAYRTGKDQASPDSLMSTVQLSSADGKPEGTIRLDEAWLGGPIFSPDGSKLAINVFAEPGTRAAQSGTQEQPLETPHAVANLPAGGPAVTGSSARDWDVATVNSTDGATPRVIDHQPGTDIASDWSPDGQSLLVHSDRGGNFDIYRVDAVNGTASALTTDPATDDWATYSPDGRMIAFTSNRAGGYHIWLMSADGSNPSRLTSGNGEDWLPIWSPDGKTLVFLSNRDGSADIFRVGIGGSGITNLTRTPNLDEWMTAGAWSPDGSQVLYVASRSIPSSGPAVGLGIAGILVWSTLLAAVLLVGVRLNRLPFGALTILLVVSVAVLASISEQYELIVAAVVAGVAVDLLLARPGRLDRALEPVAASALPALFTAGYLVALGVAGQNPWPTPIAASLVALAALVGLATALFAGVHRHRAQAAASG